MKWLKVDHSVAQPRAHTDWERPISLSLRVATAIALLVRRSGAALATVVRRFGGGAG